LWVPVAKSGLPQRHKSLGAAFIMPCVSSYAATAISPSLGVHVWLDPVLEAVSYGLQRAVRLSAIIIIIIIICVCDL